MKSKKIVKCKVWIKVPISECYTNTGKAPVDTRWIDINKGDDDNPNYRFRLVGREFKRDKREGLCVATPPLEAIRALIALAASQRNRGNNLIKKLSFIDIRQAYFHPKAKIVVYVELPDEALELGEKKGEVC